MEPTAKHFKSIFLSDIHLGTKGCQSERLLDFLYKHTCDKLYLVGDIIDGWKLEQRIYWPQEHTNVIRKFLSFAKNGTVWVNPWNSKQINIALRDSQDGVDTWKEEKINLIEDFKKYLNIDIKKIWGWGVITDADNTRQIASAEYKDFNFQ